ncbi:hypothetical protein EJB05_23215, partial [Eragrostis curvula]
MEKYTRQMDALVVLSLLLVLGCFTNHVQCIADVVDCPLGVQPVAAVMLSDARA